jgi:hypothetical protein
LVILAEQEAFPSAVTRQTSWGALDAVYGQLIRLWNFQSSEFSLLLFLIPPGAPTSMAPSLQYTNGTALLAAAMFSAACVFTWLNDPSLLVCAAFLACWRCRYSFIVINIPAITDCTKLWWVM